MAVLSLITLAAAMHALGSVTGVCVLLPDIQEEFDAAATEHPLIRAAATYVLETRRCLYG